MYSGVRVSLTTGGGATGDFSPFSNSQRLKDFIKAGQEGHVGGANLIK
jgi:hypothetical protein